MAKVANATKVINGEGEELDVLGAKGGNDINTGHVIIATATKLCLCLLVVPVMSGNHIGREEGTRGDDEGGLVTMTSMAKWEEGQAEGLWR